MEYSNCVFYNQFANIVVETTFIPNNHYDYEVGVYLKGNVFKDYLYRTNNLNDAKQMHNYYIELVKTNKL